MAMLNAPPGTPMDSKQHERVVHTRFGTLFGFRNEIYQFADSGQWSRLAAGIHLLKGTPPKQGNNGSA